MNLLPWVIFGLLVGFLMHFLDDQPVKGGVIGSIAFGIFGSLLGGLLANFLFGNNGLHLSLSTFIIALTFAVFFLLVYHSIFTNPRNKF